MTMASDASRPTVVITDNTVAETVALALRGERIPNCVNGVTR